METLTERQEARVKSTAENLHREIVPRLKSSGNGQLLKDRLKEELYRHEMLFSYERDSPVRLIVVAILALPSAASKACRCGHF